MDFPLASSALFRPYRFRSGCVHIDPTLLGSPSDPTSQLTLDVALPEITLATSSNAPAAKAAIPPAVRVVKPKKTGSKKTRTKPKATGTRCAKAGAINICTYLEEERNHQQLYGSRSQTKVGPRVVTKAAAYNIFALYLNNFSTHGLHLNSKKLRQQLNACKKKFVAVKARMDNTGTGIKEAGQAHTLSALLKQKCPSFDQMDSIFVAKPNVTPWPNTSLKLGWIYTAMKNPSPPGYSSQEVSYSDLKPNNPTPSSCLTTTTAVMSYVSLRLLRDNRTQEWGDKG
ncbi:hypothetical protein MJO29_004034 [Puccinia striiformis f. sp. tritici]|nr:hypothetical protein MJO29_004034 [Puccinia striiformis f. sp. tritici]